MDSISSCTKKTLYVPDETEVPHDHLGSYRLTLFYKTSTDQHGKLFIDQWSTDNSRDAGFIWTGLTLFQTSDSIPDIVVEQETHDKAARDAKALPKPNEPTEQRRATHNLTHLPYLSWCEHCVKAKGRENHSKRQIDRQPVIQVDYCFVNTGPDVGQRTILTAVDVQTGLSTAVVVPNKGRNSYSVAELRKFIYETGRTYGILQYDKEPALKALVTDVAKELGGMSIRATPKDWKQAHGSIGKISDTETSTSRTNSYRDLFESLHLSMDCETLPILAKSFSHP